MCMMISLVALDIVLNITLSLVFITILYVWLVVPANREYQADLENEQERIKSVEADLKRRKASAEALNRLLATTDLHDKILEHLTVSELVRVKRVCKTWNVTVDKSPTVRQKMEHLLERRRVAAEAFAKVCGITELHELILQHLTICKLLDVKRVCRHWKNIIETSHPLLQKLWLRPRSAQKVRYKPVREGRYPKPEWTREDGSAAPAPKIFINPYLKRELIRGSHSYGRESWWADKTDTRREMYICDPPAVSVRLSGDEDGEVVFEHWLQEAGGIKIKHVVDHMMPVCLESNGRKCWIGCNETGCCGRLDAIEVEGTGDWL